MLRLPSRGVAGSRFLQGGWLAVRILLQQRCKEGAEAATWGPFCVRAGGLGTYWSVVVEHVGRCWGVLCASLCWAKLCCVGPCLCCTALDSQLAWLWPPSRVLLDSYFWAFVHTTALPLPALPALHIPLAEECQAPARWKGAVTATDRGQVHAGRLTPCATGPFPAGGRQGAGHQQQRAQHCRLPPALIAQIAALVGGIHAGTLCTIPHPGSITPGPRSRPSLPRWLLKSARSDHLYRVAEIQCTERARAHRKRQPRWYKHQEPAC
jgi:hypothetical protein